MTKDSKTLSIYRNWQKKIVEWTDDLSHLIFPNTCLICDNETPSNQHQICHLCEHELHRTTFEKYIEESKLDKLFWGRIQLHATYSLLYFEKENTTQEILHQIKYQNKQKLAREMGKQIGINILTLTKFNDVTGLLPIPLHPKKKYIRGYNQSKLLADGISEITNIPVIEYALTRTKHGESQTKKNRFKRWENVQNSFSINPTHLKNTKHIALVDDVITTGATLETCAHVIRAHFPTIQISIISLALAK